MPFVSVRLSDPANVGQAINAWEQTDGDGDTAKVTGYVGEDGQPVDVKPDWQVVYVNRKPVDDIGARPHAAMERPPVAGPGGAPGTQANVSVDAQVTRASNEPEAQTIRQEDGGTVSAQELAQQQPLFPDQETETPTQDTQQGAQESAQESANQTPTGPSPSRGGEDLPLRTVSRR